MAIKEVIIAAHESFVIFGVAYLQATPTKAFCCYRIYRRKSQDSAPGPVNKTKKSRLRPCVMVLSLLLLEYILVEMLLESSNERTHLFLDLVIVIFLRQNRYT